MRFDLIVVTQEPFPYGLAATNRMLSYLKGVAQEHSVLFLTYAGPAYGTEQDKQGSGTFEKIYYRYTGATYRKTAPGVLERKAMFVWRLLKLYVLLLFYYQTKSILIYSRDEGLIRMCRLISRMKGIKIFRDITETNGAKRTKKSEESLKKLTACLDGVIVISQGIWDFFDNIPEKKKYLLPVLINPDRFVGENVTKRKYFFCCSGANLERDGLLDILNGFLEFHHTNGDYILQIASRIDTDDAYHLKCKAIMDKNTDSIVYLGELPAYEIPGKMMEATALLLTPHHEYATRGFPTKLGEYLMSGTPTICSSIEDLKSVLPKDAVIWVPTNSAEGIAKALGRITSEPDKAGQIGRTGKDWMMRNYTCERYAESLNRFMGLE